ncbi:cytoskeleton-associated protein 2-like isoform X2 [Perognathus longimembris pacificus]|uniref:cytoskeleton-associated protein 2-like isoform X2 n=1 Tax=Perognathus longimembris pacificus TaxID=214514 RepID=UPI00201A0E78|nr:cytoskeleton-associated protein 2-like isoform X2 [Perognathus longimembris pacificus]
MVGPGPSAAAEERQRKLQEYLAAKGKLKNLNTKPYLKAKNNGSIPPPSKSTIGPKKDITSHAGLPTKSTRTTNIKLQSRPTNITGSQKPKSEPLLSKRPASGCASSKANCKPSSKSHQQQQKAASSTAELATKPRRSSATQGLKPAQQCGERQGGAKGMDSVGNSHVRNKLLGGSLKEMNKENLPLTSSEPKQKPDPELRTICQPKTDIYKQTKGSLAPKQLLSKSSDNDAVLKDRVNKKLVGETQIRTLPVKSQQLPRVAHLTKPREKPSRTIPSHFIQTLSKSQASKKPVVKDISDIKANRGKCGKTNETKLQPLHTTEQKVKPMRPKTYPNLHQGAPTNQPPNIRRDQKISQCSLRPQTSVIPSTLSLKASKTSDNKVNRIFQHKTQTLNSKLKNALPQNHFLNKTAPRTRTGITTINRRGAPSDAQTNPDIKKKAATEDRRKQLEEWQKSKGKIYKRPPMELKTKRKVIEEMNISFWKSIEKEEEEKAQLELSNKINNTLKECLQLIEEGVPSHEVFTIISSIPEAEKFAKFWICKAKLLANKDNFDVIGLYEEAIKSGAAPIQELREFVLNILQDPNRTIEEEKQLATPHVTKTEQDSLAGIKLQIAPLPRLNGMPEVQDMKLVTPVRRSARIERAVSRYPEMLQEHHLLVASLDELLEVEATDCFIFRRNEALPVTLGFENLES